MRVIGPTVVKVTHRCMTRLVRGREHGGPGRKCWTQRKFDINRDPPKCPNCGRSDMWAPMAYKHKRWKELHMCTDSLCPYHHNHSRYSKHCAHNPTRAHDAFGITDEPGVRATTDEVPF